MAPKRGAASAPSDDQDARFQAQSPRKSLKHDIALGEVTQASMFGKKGDGFESKLAKKQYGKKWLLAQKKLK